MNTTKGARILLLLVLFCLIGLPHATAKGEKRIGVLLWSNEPRYTEACKGVMDQLHADGAIGASLRITVEDARASKAGAANAARKFAAGHLDLIIAIGTTAAVAVTREIRDVPVVFGMVYDPVQSKIAKGWRSSGNNTTGVSARIPMVTLMRRLKELAPVRNLAVLYTRGETNSEVQLRELLALQDTLRFRVVPVHLAAREDVSQLLPEVIGSVDAIYLSGSSIVGFAAGTVVDMATRAHVITITHLDDLTDRGVLMGVCPDPYFIGRLTGEKALRVLKGARPSAVPVEASNRLDLIINLKTAKAGQFQIPASFMKKVTKVIE